MLDAESYLGYIVQTQPDILRYLQVEAAFRLFARDLWLVCSI